jgi:hypothetical protein
MAFPNSNEKRMRATDQYYHIRVSRDTIQLNRKDESKISKDQISIAADLYAQPDRFPVRLRLIVHFVRNLPTFPFPIFPRLELDDDDLQVSCQAKSSQDTSIRPRNSSLLHMAA